MLKFCTYLNQFLLIVLLVGCGGAANEDSGGEQTNGQAPQAIFTAIQLQVMAPLVVEMRADSAIDPDGQIVEYRWNFGDGNTGLGVLYNHTYSAAGEYEVRLTVTDNDGNTSESSQLIRVLRENANPRAEIQLSITEGSAPLTVNFSSEGTRDIDGSISEFNWDFGDGNFASGESTTHIFREAGTYTVTFDVVDNEGGRNSTEALVTVYEAGTRFSVSGEITALPYTDVDGDVNDINANFYDNDGHPIANIQEVANPVMLNGYLTALESTDLTDAFAYDTDIIDFYGVELNQNDFVSLKVVDRSEGDIDLTLYRASNFELVGVSMGDNEFESVQAPDADRYIIVVQVVDRFSRYLMRVGETSLASSTNTMGQKTDFVAGEAIVKLKEDAPAFYGAKSSLDQMQLKASHRSNNRPTLAKINFNNTTTKTKLNIQAKPVGFEKFLSEKNPEAFEKLQTLRAISRLKTRSDIEYAEPNYRLHAFFEPDDPSYIYQWHYPAIALPSAWDITLGDPSVVTAVIDSGVFLSHPDLSSQLIDGYDFVSDIGTANDGDGIDADPNDPGDSSFIGFSSWHGTHVAGTVAAAMGNGEGGVGVAPDSLIMPLRALGRGGGASYDMQQAVRYAAGLPNDSGFVPTEPVDIINLSLGGSGYLQSSQDLFEQVNDRGIIVIAAAGNEKTDEPLYPASYQHVVSVAAVDFSGDAASYSNYGAFIDVAAPGGELSDDANNDGYADGVLSSAVVETETARSGGYFFYHGTSMAAPHVAGVAALMKSVNPDLTPDQFDSLLANGVMTIDRGTEGRDNIYGHGIIDAHLAVQAAIDLSNGGTTSAIVADRYVIAFDHDEIVSELRLRRIGDEALDIVDVVATEPWIEVSGVGVGTYQVSVTRGEREDGNYRGQIRFATSSGSIINIQVSMRVGDLMAIGDAGYLYILLFDMNLGATIAVEQMPAVEGKYRYRFDNVPAGEYFIAAGSDINNDGLICEEGESCGFYPSISEFETFTVGDNRADMDFTAGLFSLLSAESADAEGRKFSRFIEQ